MSNGFQKPAFSRAVLPSQRNPQFLPCRYSLVTLYVFAKVAAIEKSHSLQKLGADEYNDIKKYSNQWKGRNWPQ